MDLMGDKRLGWRTNIMARAEATWLDSEGTPHLAAAMLEEISPFGTCVRMQEPIRVGSKISIKWRREQFTGTVRHFKRQESGFVVGIQRDSAC
jgi:hypothetical protein